MSDRVNIAMIGMQVRRHLWLVGIWVIATLGLCSVWRPQPRFTLRGTGVAEIVGVTPDSRSMVCLTRRLEEVGDENNKVEWDFASGPIQVLDLYTGRQHIIDLPEQMKPDFTEVTKATFQGFLDKDSWKILFPAEPFAGRLCNLIQTNRHGERWAVQLDLDRGVKTKTRLPDLELFYDLKSTILSRKLRWIGDMRFLQNKNDQPIYELRVIDSKTGTVNCNFRISHFSQYVFSDDETLIAVVEPQTGDPKPDSDDSRASTSIWQLEPLKELRRIDRELQNVKFSPSNRSIACYDDDGEIVGIDVQTGKISNRFQLVDDKLDRRDWPQTPDRFRFSSDERLLIGYDGLRGGSSGGGFRNSYISEVWVWDLKQNRRLPNLTPAGDSFYEPNLCEDGLDQQLTPQILRDGKRVFDIDSGRTILTLPAGRVTAEITMLENGMAVLERQSQSSSKHIFQMLSKWGLKIPSSWSFGDELPEFIICEIPSGRTRKVIPRADYIVDWRSLSMSPDGRRLITKSYQSSGEYVFSVWDLSSFPDLFGPMVWSLVAPMVCLVWQYIRRARTGPNSNANDIAHSKS